MNVIAHVVVVSDLSGNVKGMKGFRGYYLKQLPAADRAIFRHFEAAVKKAYADTARLMQEQPEGGDGSQSRGDDGQNS